MKGKRLPPPAGYEERVYNPVLDVSVPDSTPYEAAAAETVARFGRIDVLVNSAGYGANTNFEETGEETIRRMLEVNLFGLMRMTRAVLPVMRRQRSGQIFNIASGTGYCGGPVPYHTSKFAVTGFSASLAFEVQPFGIHVTNVAPGLFRTGFYDKGTWTITPDRHIEDYDICRWQDEFVTKNNPQADPNELARVILDVAGTKEPPLHLPIGEDASDVLRTYARKLEAEVDKR